MKKNKIYPREGTAALIEGNEDGSLNTDAQKLPSALDNFTEIARRLGGKKLALFLDYDGTLAPVVDRPEDAQLSGGMENLLKKLASLCRVAIISGRDLSDVRNRVGLKNLIYAGSHGFDIAGPKGLRMQLEQGKKCLPALDEAEQKLRQGLKKIPGAQVERKGFAIAVHYRNMAADKIPQVGKIVDEILAASSQLQRNWGKKIIELQPDVEWDKGQALLWLMKNLDWDHPDVLPLYLGDDRTDEDAFAVLRDRGIGILVGWHGEKTAAKFGLKDVPAVQHFLHHLIEILEEDGGSLRSSP